MQSVTAGASAPACAGTAAAARATPTSDGRAGVRRARIARQSRSSPRTASGEVARAGLLYEHRRARGSWVEQGSGTRADRRRRQLPCASSVASRQTCELHRRPGARAGARRPASCATSRSPARADQMSSSRTDTAAGAGRLEARLRQIDRQRFGGEVAVGGGDCPVTPAPGRARAATARHGRPLQRGSFAVRTSAQTNAATVLASSSKPATRAFGARLAMRDEDHAGGSRRRSCCAGRRSRGRPRRAAMRHQDRHRGQRRQQRRPAAGPGAHRRARSAP